MNKYLKISLLRAGSFLLLVLAFSSCFVPVIAQQPSDTIKESEWKGFERIDFSFEGRSAHIVIPSKALQGNPWLWRARFPDYHAEIDSALLSKGFHVVYVDTNDQFGSPKAVAVWNNFYAFLIQKYNLSPKVALHGHSRGGLFIYSWAKANSEKIACIYADAVVCDFKSWPGGFGESDGSKGAWETLKTEYEFSSDEEAKSYNNNPIDKLENLVKAEVPIFHTIGLNDKVVPPEENALKLVKRYIRLGGTATVSPCSSGVQKSKGHHYDIDNPRLVVDFILYNAANQ